MQKNSNREIEIKLRLAGTTASTRRKLQNLGFQVSTARVFEANAVFDTPERRLQNARELLRIRSVKKSGLLTFKGVPQEGKHKSREELEVNVSDPAGLAVILTRLGYREVFRYEKFRTEFKQAGRAGVVTVDETPIGNYLELEGKPSWIDRTAQMLGFAESDYITSSYGRLYLTYCDEHKLVPANMVFKKRR